MRTRVWVHAAVTAAAVVMAWWIAELSRLRRAVVATQEDIVSTVNDLTDAVAKLTQADARLAADFVALRQQIADMPTDRPLNAEEQAALDAAVVAIQERTAAILAVDPDPNTPVRLGDKAGAQGGVVEMVSTSPTAPAAMTGPQGGTVDLDDDDPTPTEGVVGEAQYVDLRASEPVETGPNAPAGAAAEKDAAEAADTDDDTDEAVAEPAPGEGDNAVAEPAPDAPLSESPRDGSQPPSHPGSPIEF